MRLIPRSFCEAQLRGDLLASTLPAVRALIWMEFADLLVIRLLELLGPFHGCWRGSKECVLSEIPAEWVELGEQPSLEQLDPSTCPSKSWFAEKPATTALRTPQISAVWGPFGATQSSE